MIVNLNIYHKYRRYFLYYYPRIETCCNFLYLNFIMNIYSITHDQNCNSKLIIVIVIAFTYGCITISSEILRKMPLNSISMNGNERSTSWSHRMKNCAHIPSGSFISSTKFYHLVHPRQQLTSEVSHFIRNFKTASMVMDA